VFPSFPSHAPSISPCQLPQPQAREPIPSSGGNGLLLYSDEDTENRQSRLLARAFHPPLRKQGLSSPFSVTGAVVVGGVGASRFLFSPSTAADTVPVNLAYSTEKDAWLTAAAQAFNSKNVALANSKKIIQVALGDSGSLDVGDKIFRGESRPVAWSPASELEWRRLDYQWNQKYGQNINATSTALYSTSPFRGLEALLSRTGRKSPSRRRHMPVHHATCPLRGAVLRERPNSPVRG
jgi:hypothetical protein